MKHITESTAPRRTFFRTFGLGAQRDAFLENLSIMAAAGMNVSEAIAFLQDEGVSGRMRRILRQIHEDIESGFALWKALERSGLFPVYTIAFIRIGEESGKLAENLQTMSAHQEKEREFHSKIRSAMTYPVLVFFLTGAIGIGIAWFILPKLALVFSQLKIELPLITKLLIRLGTFLQLYGRIVVPLALLGFFLVVFVLFFFPKTKRLGQMTLLNLPGIGSMLREAELARMSYILGTLLRSGVPPTQALSSLAQSTEFPRYSKQYAQLAQLVEEGNSFQQSFKFVPEMKRLFPAMLQQFIGIAEQTGTLSDAFLKIHRVYEARTELSTKNLAILLEPFLLVVVWLGVVAVALAVILPIYSLIGGLNTG